MAKFISIITFVIISILCSSNVYSQPRSSTFTLSWTDNSNNETGFKVYRKSGTTFTEIGSVAANVTTFVAPPITANEGSQVCFAASAFNTAGESAKAEACGTIPVTAVTSLPLNMEGKVLPEYGAIQMTIQKPVGATRAVLSLDVFDPDFPDEGELWVNDKGPIALFGAAGNSANQQIVATIEFDIPLSYLVDGVNKFRFTHFTTDGYRINAASVRFDISLPGSPTGLTIKAQ